MHRAVCLFTSQLLLVLIATTHEGMARLSSPGWLATHQDDLPVCRWSPIQALTGWASFNFINVSEHSTSLLSGITQILNYLVLDNHQNHHKLQAKVAVSQDW